MYTQDILEGYIQQTFVLKKDSEGEVYCTLVKFNRESNYNKSMLYIHGFSDYFFQTELAEQFYQNGYNFYAVDLRKNGRSLRDWQKPSNLFNIKDYFEDFDVVINQIKAEQQGNLYICGHSTGGLAISLYLSQKKECPCKALILNSPFLEMNKGEAVKRIGLPIVSILANIMPNKKLHKAFSPLYGESLHKSKKGEWDYRLDWKPIAVSYVTFSWLAAIHRAHKKLRKGLNIKCPVLLLSSNKSTRSRIWTDDFFKTDIVLNVADIERLSTKVSKNCVYLKIEDGMHDLALSKAKVRSTLYSTIFNWLKTI